MFPQLLFVPAANFGSLLFSLGSLSNTIFFIFEVVKPFLTLVLMITGTGCK